MNNMENNNLYEILGVTREASDEDIKKAFRKKAVEYHPDKTNGDKVKEELFKKINDAYSILSDPNKKKLYDQFGVIDGNGQSPNIDLNDILGGLSGMFGGVPGGGFQFSFSSGTGQNMEEDLLSSIFGSRNHQKKHFNRNFDMVEIPIDICDIYYGRTKKVEFDVVEKCIKCEGTGAFDKTFIINCITCNGKGRINQQLNPFFIQTSICHSCGGKGTTIKNNKFCTECKGKKHVFSKKQFDLKLPKGIINNYEIKMDNKGSYDENMNENKDLIFKFKYDINEPYKIDENMNVIYQVDITIEDLLAGFEKNLKIYNENVLLKSLNYFNPNNIIKIDGFGIHNIKKNKSGDLIFKFNIKYTDNDKFVKYNEALRKITKKPPRNNNVNSNENIRTITIA